TTEHRRNPIRSQRFLVILPRLVEPPLALPKVTHRNGEESVEKTAERRGPRELLLRFFQFTDVEQGLAVRDAAHSFGERKHQCLTKLRCVGENSNLFLRRTEHASEHLDHEWRELRSRIGRGIQE